MQNVEITSLDNGIRVITEEMPHVRSVSAGVWIGTGSRHESERDNGISHFIEHMLFKGTANRSAEQIAREADSFGGNLDAYTSKELVSYNTKVLDDNLPQAFDVLADLVLNPVFRPEDIEKEKGVILEELKMEFDNPEYLVHETFVSNFWKNHALGRSIIGTKKSIRAFSRDQIESYYRDAYSPKNVFITAAGRLKHQQIVDLVQRYFSSLKKTPESQSEPQPAVSAPLILKEKRSLEQVHLCMGVPAYPIADPRRHGVYILSTILGGGMSSRLFQNIREQHGLAYTVFTELNLHRDTGCMAVYAGTSVENVRRVVDMTLSEFAQISRSPVPEEELRRAKDHLKGSLALGLESTGSRMSHLARQELFFGRFFTLDEMVDAIERVTAEQVLEIAQDFFSGRQVGVTVLGRLNGLQIEAQELVC